MLDIHTKDFKSKLILEEYKLLRQKIDNQSKLIVQSFTFSVVTSCALLGYLLTTLKDIGITFLSIHLLLCPLLIIVPISYLIIENRKEIYKWATFICVFHEKNDKTFFESALAIMNKNNGTSETLSPMFLAYWSLTFVCLFLYIFLSIINKIFELWQLILPLLFIWLIYRAHYKFKYKLKLYKSSCYKEWRSIKNNEYY